MLLTYANNFYGYGYGGRGLYFDWTYLLVLAGLVLSLLAQGKVKSTFAKYSKIRSRSGLTGAEAAQRVLASAGIYDVSIQSVSGNLTDYYDPRSKVLKLSDSTYGSDSVAAVGVAAMSAVHAIQHQQGYGPLVLRSTLVPAANFGSQLAWPVFFAGLIFSLRPLLTAGIVLFSLAVLFSAGDSSGGDQRFQTGSFRVKQHGHGNAGRKQRREKSAYSGSADLCGSTGIFYSAAAAADHSCRRKTAR